MTAMLLFLVVIAAIAGWWLSQQRLMSKPWLEEGPLTGVPGAGASTVPAAAVGLGVFLAVVGSLFALLISAYSLRTSLSDGQPLPAPKLLWVNTGALILSSAALHLAQVAAKRGDLGAVRAALVVGAVSALAFLAGQLLVWRQLTAAGYYLAGNPASSFFYLITAIHGLHLAGGMVALGRTAGRAWSGVTTAPIALGVKLCAAYWHFMLALWLLLFFVLTRGGADFLAICRSLVT